ncbi:MAG: ribbon-helix-helix protein, CopG family [Pyrodictiaceae archaeon]
MPWMAINISDEMARRIENIARRKAKSLSRLIREAIMFYMACYSNDMAEYICDATN